MEEIIEEKAIDENPHEGFLVLYEYYSNYSNSDTGEQSIGSTQEAE